MRRERIRQAALQRRKEEEEAMAAEAEDDDEEDEESEYETDSEAERQLNARHKPVFVPKKKRETVRERELLEAEEIAREEEHRQKLVDRQRESKHMLVETIRREEEMAASAKAEHELSDQEMPDDNDEDNEQEEYEMWRIRELRRIKRDKEEREERAKELAEVERRRNMTEEERLEDDKRLDALAPRQEKKHKFTFMQKYYHKGAFFMDKAQKGEEELYLRDFQAPTADDTVDKNLLPKPMQLRRGQWGHTGRTKHTHLTDVDTTDWTAAWAQKDKQSAKDMHRMAGMKGAGSLDRPAARGGGGGAKSAASGSSAAGRR